MRRKLTPILILAGFIIAAAAAVALPSLGDEGVNQNVTIVRDGPGGGSCNCPAIWDPVVCRNAAGERFYFSNGCIAGCNGFTRCAEYEVPEIGH